MTEEFNLSEKMRIFKEGEEVWTDGTNEVLLFKDVKEFIRLLKEKAGDVNKHLNLHNVDECECCVFLHQKNWKCVYEILQIINKLAGDKLK